MIEDKSNKLLTNMSILCLWLITKKSITRYPVNVLLKPLNFNQHKSAFVSCKLTFISTLRKLRGFNCRMSVQIHIFPCVWREIWGREAIGCLNTKIFSQKVSIVMQQKSYQMRCPCIATCNSHLMDKSVV